MTSIKLGVLSSVAVLAASGVCFAQDPAPAAAAPAPAPAAEASASGTADMGMATPAPAPAAAAAPGGSDHDQMAGRLAIGYLGKSTMGLRAVNDTVAPVIGVRYWLDSGMGIDAGLGLLIASSSAKNAAGATVDGPSTTAFILHGGLPLSLASEGSFSFQIVPELNLGIASGTDHGVAGGPDTDHSGFSFDIGARAGSEVSFGFIGIPQLSLQAGIGLSVALQSMTHKSTAPGAVETSESATTIGTTVNGNPWDIFTSSIAALYYF
ncbi:MAG TPA: hypothetical protein VL137_11550 [Polyangiaceae bacterium]|nr:hypothetical protein [Polyangiaceae bacterium]